MKRKTKEILKNSFGIFAVVGFVVSFTYLSVILQQPAHMHIDTNTSQKLVECLMMLC